MARKQDNSYTIWKTLIAPENRYGSGMGPVIDLGCTPASFRSQLTISSAARNGRIFVRGDGPDSQPRITLQDSDDGVTNWSTTGDWGPASLAARSDFSTFHTRRFVRVVWAFDPGINITFGINCTEPE